MSEEKPKKPRSKFQPKSPRSLENLKKNQFKPGQSGNPGGVSANPVLAALRKITIESYQEIIDLACRGNVEELRTIAESIKILSKKDATKAELDRARSFSTIQVGIARSLYKAVGDGDWDVIEKIISRLIGPMEAKLNITSNNVVRIFDRAQIAAANKQLEDEY